MCRVSVAGGWRRWYTSLHSTVTSLTFPLPSLDYWVTAGGAGRVNEERERGEEGREREGEREGRRGERGGDEGSRNETE